MGRQEKTLVCFLIALAIYFPFPYRGGAAWSGETAVSLQSSVTLLKNRDYFPALHSAIDKARRDIVLAYFIFKVNDKSGNYPGLIMKSLIAAAKRGVQVTVLLDRRRDESGDADSGNLETMEKLRKRGIAVYLDSPDITTHTKLAVIDGKFLFLGSHNLTQSAMRYNNEISVLIESSGMAAEVLEYIKSLSPEMLRAAP